MATLAVLTPSYRLDLPSLVELHRSVLRHAPDEVVHHVVVPDRDVPLLSELRSDRLCVRPVSEFLPAQFLSSYPLSLALRSKSWVPNAVAKIEAVNLLRPWPPVRGWILQQLVKIAAVGRIDADVVLTVDSDVTMIRPFGADDFFQGGAVRFYRKPGAIGADLPGHSRWHAVSGRLLGLPPGRVDVATDYVASLLAWDPAIARRMQERVSQVSGRGWAASIARELHFSECILYGSFIDGLGTDHERSFAFDESLCRAHWDPTPLDRAGADRFLESIEPQDLAVQIQSTSNTPADIRNYIVEAAIAKPQR